MVITWLDFGEVLLETFILAYFLLKFGCVFSRSNTILTICQEWLVRLMWNEKEIHRLDTGYNMWPWPLTSLITLTLDVSRSNFEIALFQELLVWLMLNENEVSWYDTGLTLPFDHTHELRNGTADWHKTKRMWAIHSRPCYWLVWPRWGGQMYRIVTGVTSDVGMPSTYLVLWFNDKTKYLPHHKGFWTCSKHTISAIAFIYLTIPFSTHLNPHADTTV